MYVYGTAVAVVFKAPDLIEQLIAREYLVRIGREVIQQLQLLGRCVDLLAVDDQLIVGQVDHELVPADFLDGFFIGIAHSAQDGTDTRDDLLGFKGLDHIVVRSQLQTEDLVKYLALGGEHNDGAVGGLADLPAYLPAVHLGQHDVEQHQRRLFTLKELQRLLAVVGDRGVVALFLDVQA